MTSNVNCDWLQMHVLLSRRDFDKTDCIFFTIVKAPHQTQMFKSLYYIHDVETSEEVAVLAADPRSEMCMKENAGILKIVNKYLYQKNLYAFVKMMLKVLDLQFQNITRLDIAMDFLSFDTMKVPEFIERFRSDIYLKKVQCKYRDMGSSRSVEKGKLTGGCEALKFGKETSEVCYQLYNKSLEQSEKTFKPWILETWKDHGYDGKRIVWRLEFSINRLRREIVTESGEILSMRDLEILKHLPEAWKIFFCDHFNFVYLEVTKRGNFRKQSRSAPLILFNNFDLQPCRIKLSGKQDSGRSAKIFAKNLMKLNQELRGADFDLSIAGNELFTFLVKSRNIEEWCKKKLGENLHYSDRIVNLIESGRNTKLQIEIANLPASGKYLSAKEQAALIEAKKIEFPPPLQPGTVQFYDQYGRAAGYFPAPF